MIIQVSDDVTRLGIRLKNRRFQQYLADWKKVLLVVLPGQADNPCGPNGSPWFLHGCWPCLPTGVDLANPPAPDFPAISIPAEGIGSDCELVFGLPKRFKEIPHGRYTGRLMYNPVEAADPCGGKKKKKKPKPKPLDRLSMLPWIYRNAPCSTPYVCCPPPPVPAPRSCVFAEFDIDLGPRCGDHIVDYASVTYPKGWSDADGC